MSIKKTRRSKGSQRSNLTIRMVNDRMGIDRMGSDKMIPDTGAGSSGGQRPSGPSGAQSNAAKKS